MQRDTPLQLFVCALVNCCEGRGVRSRAPELWVLVLLLMPSCFRQDEVIG